MKKPSFDRQTDILTLVAQIAFSMANPVLGGLAGITVILGREHIKSTDNEGIALIPLKYRHYIPTAVLALQQMRSDIRNSPLLSYRKSLKGEEEISRINKILNPEDNMVLQKFELDKLFRNNSWAVASKKDIALLKELSKSNQPIKIDCQSICVAASAALLSLNKRYKLNLEIDHSGASGVEQVKTQGFMDDDIVITADAPAILGNHEFPFQKKLTVTREYQSLLFKKGSHHRSKRAIYIYPNSSVDHQLKWMAKINKSNREAFKFPTGSYAEELKDLSDFIFLAEEMEPGDYVFAWDPLRAYMLKLDLFEEIPNTGFWLPISLYLSDKTKFPNKYIDALLRLFIHEIRYISMKEFYALSLLLKDNTYRESLLRGSGIKFGV